MIAIFERFVLLCREFHERIQPGITFWPQRAKSSENRSADLRVSL